MNNIDWKIGSLIRNWERWKGKKYFCYVLSMARNFLKEPFSTVIWFFYGTLTVFLLEDQKSGKVPEMSAGAAENFQSFMSDFQKANKSQKYSMVWKMLQSLNQDPKSEEALSTANQIKKFFAFKVKEKLCRTQF